MGSKLHKLKKGAAFCQLFPYLEMPIYLLEYVDKLLAWFTLITTKSNYSIWKRAVSQY